VGTGLESMKFAGYIFCCSLPFKKKTCVKKNHGSQPTLLQRAMVKNSRFVMVPQTGCRAPKPPIRAN
jgi:hypothetical protein